MGWRFLRNAWVAAVPSGIAAILWMMRELRAACAVVAERARRVRIERGAIAGYAASLPIEQPPPAAGPEAHPSRRTHEELAAFWLTLDAINFGSGWFPTLRKRDGRSGYFTIASGVRERFEARGPWRAAELAQLAAADLGRAGAADLHDIDRLTMFADNLVPRVLRLDGVLRFDPSPPRCTAY
jgi:Potential Queuosine, Q, salvage protein family